MHFAAQGVIAGAYDVVVAAGVEVMTRTPMGASIVQGMGFPFPQEQQDRYAETGLPPQGIGADMIADEYDLSREDLDAFGAQSQLRAAVARTPPGAPWGSGPECTPSAAAEGAPTRRINLRMKILALF